MFSPFILFYANAPDAKRIARTHCLQSMDKLNGASARPHIFQSGDDRREFGEFIEKLSNATFENYEQLPMNRTFGIDSNQYLDLLWNLTLVFKPELNSGSANKLYLQDTITELGICYAVNSKIAVYNSYR